MDYSLIFAYIAAIFVFLGTPGPVTVMIANASAKYGFKAGFATLMGTNTASLILIIISFAVIQGVFAVSETALSYLTLLGALYLLYFSLQILKDKIDIEQIKQSGTMPLSKNHFKDGFMVGISNPKDVLFFIAFFPLFFAVADNAYVSMLVLTVIWVILDYCILSVYSLIFSKITSNKAVNIISRLSGFLLLLVAIFAVYKTSLQLWQNK